MDGILFRFTAGYMTSLARKGYQGRFPRLREEEEKRGFSLLVEFFSAWPYNEVRLAVHLLNDLNPRVWATHE